MCKNLFISIMKHGVFCTLQSANPKFIQQFHVFSFYVPSHMHSQTRAVSSNDLYLFWLSSYSVYFDLSTSVSSLPCWQSLLASCRSYLPCSTPTYTLFSNTIMNMMNTMIEKQKIVQCHWLVKIGEKKQDEMEKNWVLRLLTMEEAGSKRALGQKNSCESEHWKYSRKLRFSGRRRSVLIASRTSPYS